MADVQPQNIVYDGRFSWAEFTLFFNYYIFNNYFCIDMTRKLIQKYHKWGLKVNTNKTKHMVKGDLHEDLILEDDMQAGPGLSLIHI